MDLITTRSQKEIWNSRCQHQIKWERTFRIGTKEKRKQKKQEKRIKRWTVEARMMARQRCECGYAREEHEEETCPLESVIVRRAKEVLKAKWTGTEFKQTSWN